ncbi:MAG: biopolymer transporter ExbD [Spirochaetia bacterium]|nr:biopolymer transporter ExbD [Spirochaetia bacterium]
MKARVKNNDEKEFKFIAAMADLAMLLLIFFMVTSSIAQTKLKDISVPEGFLDSEVKHKIEISLDLNNNIYIENQSVLLENIPYVLAEKNIKKEDYIGLISDKKNKYGEVKKILRVLSQNNYTNIKFHAKKIIEK